MSRLRDHYSDPAVTRTCPDPDGCARLYHRSLGSGLAPGDVCECCGTPIGNEHRVPSPREWLAVSADVRTGEDAAVAYNVDAARPPASGLELAGWAVDFPAGVTRLLGPCDAFAVSWGQPTRMRPLFVAKAHGDGGA